MVFRQANRRTQRDTPLKKFSVTFVIERDEDNNILSSFDDNHEDDVHDLITNVMYDVDDVKIDNLTVKERG